MENSDRRGVHLLLIPVDHLTWISAECSVLRSTGCSRDRVEVKFCPVVTGVSNKAAVWGPGPATGLNIGH